MKNLYTIINATAQISNQENFRFLGVEKSSLHFALLSTDGEESVVPLAISLIAFHPEYHFYLGMSYEGLTWKSSEEGIIGKVPCEGALTSLRFFQGRFWAVGTNFQVFYSVDGVTWVESMTRESIGVSNHRGIWTSIIGAENETLFAVGLDGIVGSFDGTDWSLDRVEGTSFFDVIEAKGEVLACGDKGRVARRVDEEWEVLETEEEGSFISFCQNSKDVYISTEDIVYKINPKHQRLDLEKVGQGGKLFIIKTPKSTRERILSIGEKGIWALENDECEEFSL